MNLLILFSNWIDETYVDPDIVKKINIGFPLPRPSRSEQLKERLAHVKAQRSSTALEKAARSQQCKLILLL